MTSMLWHCSIRRARLTDYGCAAVHNQTVEAVEKARTRYAAAPLTPSDHACAGCDGVKARFEAGLEKEPSYIPELYAGEYMVKPRINRSVRLKVRSPLPPEERTCACGATFTPQNHGHRKCKACGQRKLGSRVTLERRACDRCGASFQPKTRRNRYCSSVCCDADRPAIDVTAERTCACGKAFTTTNPKQIWCGHLCKMRHWRKREWKERPCDQCGTSYTPKMQRNRFCSNDCRRKSERVAARGEV